MQGDSVVSKPPLLTVDDVAREFRVTRRAVYDRVRKGNFPQPVHLGRSLRWRRAEIDQFIDQL